jgi:DnaJ family protein B protein 4
MPDFVFNNNDAENLFARIFSEKLYSMYGEDSVLGELFARDTRTNGGYNNKGPGSGVDGTGFSAYRAARAAENPFRSNPKQHRRKADEILKDLHVPLEDLYTGSVKRLKIQRHVIDQDSGRNEIVDNILEVDIKRGWKSGTKVTFENHGDDNQNGDEPADLTFIIKEQPHSVFKREGNDLVHSVKISLGKALTNPVVNITTLDGRKLSIVVSEIVTPGFRKLVKGEGMPIAKEVGKMGDLYIVFDVLFPKTLTQAQKATIAHTID